LLTRLGFRLDETQLRRYERGTQNIRQQADAAAESFRNMFLAFAGFGAIRSIAKTADEMQSLEARIGQLPQTVTSAGDAFERVAAKATEARQGIEGYASFYIKAGNATQDFIKDQEELLKVVDGAAIALAASGSDATRQKEAFFQLGQAIGSPVIQMEEMNTIIDVAPDLFRALGKAIPGAEGNLKKFVSTGKVTGEMLAKGLMAILPQFVDQMKAMPMSIGTATVVIGNRWSVFIARLNRESSAVTNIANFFLSTFDKIEAGLADMVKFFGGATNTLKFFGIALAAALAPLILKTAAGAVAFLLSPLGLLIASLVLVGLALEDFYQWLNFGDSVIGTFLGGLDGMGKAVKFVDALKKSFNDFAKSDAIQFLIKKVTDFKNSLIDSFNGGVISKFIDALSRLGAYLADVIPFDKIMENLSVIFQGAIKLFFGILDVISGVFKAVLGFLTGDFDLWFEGVKQIFSGLGEIVSGLWDVLRGTAAQYLTWMGTLFRVAFDGIKSIISDSIFGGIKWAAMKGWEFLKSLFGFGVSVGVDAKPVGGATQTPSIGGITSMTPAVPSVSPSVVAGAAAAPNGVPVASGGNSVVLNVNQTLPPGTPAETATAAREAVTQAFNALPIDRLARQMGQVGG
jgi:tape measure domain-containing protein